MPIPHLPIQLGNHVGTVTIHALITLYALASLYQRPMPPMSAISVPVEDRSRAVERLYGAAFVWILDGPKAVR